MRVDETLLIPSLSHDEGDVQAIYSPTALMLTAFFGGPFAVILMTALNSQKLKRVRTDVSYLLFGAALSTAFIKLMYGSAIAATVFPAAGENAPRLLVRAVSLALFAGAYGLHRRAYRNMRFAGLAAPRALPVALGCIVLGSLLLSAVIALVRM
jgi:hypothetical protein